MRVRLTIAGLLMVAGLAFAQDNRALEQDISSRYIGKSFDTAQPYLNREVWYDQEGKPYVHCKHSSCVRIPEINAELRQVESLWIGRADGPATGTTDDLPEQPEEIRLALERAQKQVDEGRVALVNIKTDYRARAGTVQFSDYST